ncbi:MAG: hypothetical protein L0H99_01900 [Loigolactobacillus coryniformis]|jgi:hypothetical protein|uniref:Uncharacterized protein n=1 Tax=Loigolactobacillus coryniformis TaxID=1610 RepID=A0A5B8TGF2_9LACO|nr:hypothetical protein [Loigolactobacillus coryniformis]MDN5951474.1 hypothetical protein [Loigolactobacillus coryniformis]MDN5952633.1 hypothetical protein [Loigolactobacillus coryniformis]QEA53733.1 hypothetical protein FGL77_10855 [Loigolactobacillus coryniformis]RRG05804.1 MAG: hypothetical protein DUD28_04910 [Lactobacillus sp.]
MESKVLLHVDCDFSMETSAAQAMIGQIRAYVPIGIKIALELYSTTATYDVILTDMDRVYSPATPTFVFLNLQNELDVPRLKNFLTDHYFDKLFQ